MTIEIVIFPMNSKVIFHSYVKLPEGNENRWWEELRKVDSEKCFGGGKWKMTESDWKWTSVSFPPKNWIWRRIQMEKGECQRSWKRQDASLLGRWRGSGQKTAGLEKLKIEGSPPDSCGKTIGKWWFYGILWDLPSGVIKHGLLEIPGTEWRIRKVTDE